MIERALRLVDGVSMRTLEERGWTSLGSFSQRHGSWEKAFARPQAEESVQPVLVAILSTSADGGPGQLLRLEWCYGAEGGQRYVRRSGPAVELEPSEEGSAAAAERIRESACSAAALAESLTWQDLDLEHKLPRGDPLAAAEE